MLGIGKNVSRLTHNDACLPCLDSPFWLSTTFSWTLDWSFVTYWFCVSHIGRWGRLEGGGRGGGMCEGWGTAIHSLKVWKMDECEVFFLFFCGETKKKKNKKKKNKSLEQRLWFLPFPLFTENRRIRHFSREGANFPGWNYYYYFFFHEITQQETFNNIFPSSFPCAYFSPIP